MPGTLSKLIKDNRDYVKSQTKLPNETLDLISEEGLNKMKEMLDEGAPSNFVADLFTSSLNKALQDHSMVMKEKVEECIENKDFKEEIINNNGNIVYQKTVDVDGHQYTFDQKTFSSERQCVAWLRLRKLIRHPNGLLTPKIV